MPGGDLFRFRPFSGASYERIRMRDGRRDGHIFRSQRGGPFNPRGVADRVKAPWVERGLERLTMHECRHTYASLMIAAGVNAKALSTYMGHASITVTFDRYGHLMRGNEAEAAFLLDEYLGAPRPAVKVPR